MRLKIRRHLDETLKENLLADFENLNKFKASKYYHAMALRYMNRYCQN